MKKNGFAHRAGYRLGRSLRAYSRWEDSSIRRFQGKGARPRVIALMLWLLKLFLLGVLLYFAVWVALIYAFLVVASVLQNSGLIFPDRKSSDNGWRHGSSGYGDYSGEFRIDPGRFDEEK